jgi:carboxylesterase
LLAGAEPFAHNGDGEIGVLLSHGFTGSPNSMRPWGRRLAAEGFTVRAPLLPGHGTTWQDMNRTRWPQWYDAVERSFDELLERCRMVFAFGLSMGGTLCLRLAQQHGREVAGLVLVNPSVTTLRKETRLLPMLSRFVPSVQGAAGDIAKQGVEEVGYDRTPTRALLSLTELWRDVRPNLGRITQPLLLLRSAVDNVVEPVNAEIVLSGVRSTDTAEIVLPDSYHVATLDNDAPTIFAASIDFAERVHRELIGAAS